MLYNPESASNLAVPWFEPRYWVARGAVVGKALGRGTTLIVEEGSRRLVLRHYRRGGLIARISPDRYLWHGESQTRPFQELVLIARLHAAGLPVPVPVASRYLRDGATYSGDIITEYLPETESLAQRLTKGPPGFDTWTAIGRCLRRFHDAGVCHADLNAHNILLRDATTVFLIDFDRGTQRAPAPEDEDSGERLRGDGLWRDANLVRLRRSLEKLNDQRGDHRFDDLQWHCLLSAYL